MNVIDNLFESKKNKLYNLVTHCIEKVPYYRENWSVDIPSLDEFDYNFFQSYIPITEKKHVLQDSTVFISSDFNKDDLISETTSGTSGTPMTCYKSKQTILTYSYELWRMRREHYELLKPTDIMAKFYTFRNIDKEKGEFLSNEIKVENELLSLPLIDLSTEKLIELWEAVLVNKPKWLQGPGTAVYLLAKAVESQNLERYKFELIELNGEFVPSHYHDLIESVFQTKVTNHYGSREFWAIAYTCKCGKHHFNDKNMFVETLRNEQTGENEVVITALTNMSWPLVRYRLGDNADVSYEYCECNKKMNYIMDIKRGRREECFNLGEHKYINSILFSTISRRILDPSNLNVTAISQYQIVKKSDWELVVKLCKRNWQLTDEQIIKIYDEELRKVIGDDVQVEYEFYDVLLPDNRTGKFRDFIDESLLTNRNDAEVFNERK